MKLIFKRQARTELKQASQFYNDERRGLGIEFLDEVDAALKVILNGPNRFGVTYADVHCYVMGRFPYSIFYRVSKNRVEVVAIGHHRRQPGYWHGRIE
jgi:toxin ParE1/3/4